VEIIRTIKLIFKYITRDEEANIKEEKIAIDNLDLNIEEGSFVAVLGHNGSGKSTLAKHLNGILVPSEGDVIVLEYNTKNDEDLLDIRKSVGMVFQNPDNQIIGNIVEEDVAFGPENIGVETKEIWDRVDKSLESVGMSAYRLKSPNRLSGGQKQRVAIAGIMAMKPRCIVLDEPTAMLDPNGRIEVIKTIKELNKLEGITIILITHYMEEVIDADRVIVMDKGKIVMDDIPKEIFSRVEELKELRLDIPVVTELAHLLRKEGLDLPKGIIKTKEFMAKLLPLIEENKCQ
jgi:ABC transporter related protein